MKSSSTKIEPHHAGHRMRVKSKFLKINPQDFDDYELLELLLFYSIPRRDVKPLAKLLISKFSSFSQLINTDVDKILLVNGVTESVCVQFKIVKEILNRVLKTKVVHHTVMSSWSSVLEYLKFNMGYLKIEQFRTLFLNKKNMLISDEVMSTGTIDEAPVYPREIVKKALFHEASALILVHNHPSGSSKPSKADIDLTAQIVKACDTISVIVHDHIIIGENEYYSFKSNMLL